MNSRQRRTLEKIFENPTRADVRWRDIESLIQALQGKVVKKRNGSRVCFLLDGRKGIFHTPHPENETDKGALEDVRDFLEKAGVKP